MARLDIEVVRERLRSNDLELLSDYNGCTKLITVKCKCGTIFSRHATELMRGHTRTCGCGMYQYQPGNKSYKWKGFGDISSRHWYAFKHGALTRGLVFDISIEDAWNKFIDQDKKCTYTGIDLFFPIKTYSVGNASLDRINPSIGYTKENIQWVHKFVNDVKWDLGNKKFLYYCKLITCPICSDEPAWDCYNFISHNGHWEGCGNLSGNFWYTIKSKKNDFDITIEDAWNQYLKQNGRCALTGLSLDVHSKVGVRTASLGKINNRLGYTKSNIRWIHKDVANKMRKYFCDQSLKYWCKKVVDYYGKKQQCINTSGAGNL